MQVSTKKTSKNESKLDQNSNVGSAPKKAIWHSWSADWHKLEARPEDFWIEISPNLFNFLEMRMCLNSYKIILLIFRSIPTSINKGCLSKFSTLFCTF